MRRNFLDANLNFNNESLEFEQNENMNEDRFQAEDSSDLPEDVTLSSRDSVLDEMRVMKKMMLLQTCVEQNVQIDMSKMTSDQIEKIQLPLFSQVIEFFKAKVDQSILSEDQSMIYKNLSYVSKPQEEPVQVLKQQENSRNAAIVVMNQNQPSVDQKVLEDTKFDISNAKKFEVINQDFYTKSLGNHSTPRNEELIEVDSLKNKSLDEDELIQEDDQAQQPRQANQARGQAPNDAVQTAQDQLNQIESAESVQLQNEVQNVSTINKVDDTVEVVSLLQKSPPIVKQQAMKNTHTTPNVKMPQKIQEIEELDDSGLNLPPVNQNNNNLEVNESRASTIQQVKEQPPADPVSLTKEKQEDVEAKPEQKKETVDLGVANPPLMKSSMRPLFGHNQKIVPESQITQRSKDVEMAQIDLKKPLDSSKQLPEDPDKPIQLNKTDVLFHPTDTQYEQKEKTDGLPLIMKTKVQDDGQVEVKKETDAPQKREDFKEVEMGSDDISVDLDAEEESEQVKPPEEEAKEQHKNCDCKKSDPMMAMGANPEGEGEKEEDENEEIELSWKGLVRFIAQNHPVHPITKQKFALGQRITVNDYATKLLDPCLLHVAVRQCKRIAKKYYKLSRGDTDERKIPRPESLKDLPESESESSELEDEVGFGGLTAAGAHLGVGAILYLQTMKTFCVLFFILTILNLPVYFIYSQTTLDNSYTSIDIAFQYFTFGNFGRIKKDCSSVPVTFDPASQTKINLKCDYPSHYMTEILYYGFLYQHDPRIGPSSGEYQCTSEFGHDMGREPLTDPEGWATTYSQYTQSNQKDGQTSSQQDSAENTQDNTEAENNAQSDTQGNSRRLSIPSSVKETDDEATVAAALGKTGIETEGEEEHNEEVIDRIIQNTTVSNIDNICKSNSKFLFKDEEAYKEIQDFFDQFCYEKDECVLDLENLPGRPFSEIVSDTCKIRILGDPSLGPVEAHKPQITSSEFIVVYGCMGSTYKINDFVLHKQQYACIFVIIDFIGVLFMLYIFDKLQGLNKEYIDIIDDNQITMKDFAVCCKNVLLDKYTQDIRLVKMKIWLHFTRQFEEYRLQDNQYEVVDVVLSLCNEPETLQIFKMEQVQNDINIIKSKLAAGEFKNAVFFQKQEELEDLNDIYDREKDRFKQFIDAKKKASKTIGIVAKCHRIEKIDYIFVTFKNVECVDKVCEVLEREPSVSRMIRCLFCIKNKQQTDKEFLKEELLVEQAVEPDEMLWETLKIPDGQGGNGTVILQLISAVFVLFSGGFQLLFEGLRFRIVADDAPLLCPSQVHEGSVITNEQAYADVIAAKPKGLMPCFCSQQFRKNPFAVPAMTFIEFDPREEDDTKYCAPWFQATLGNLIIRAISAFSILALNALISKTFEGLSRLQMRHTTIETTKRSFLQIMLLEFLNTGIIMCLVSLAGLNKVMVSTEEWMIPDKKIKYDGFDSDWYFEVGRIITLTCFLSSFVANFLDLRGYCKAALKQRSDRRGGSNIKKFPHDEDDDMPNTKLLIQDELEKSYEGPDFGCETTLSRMMSMTWTLLVFSTGMPILYLLGFVFFLLTYITNKLLIMKYYKRTDSILSREIPLTSVKMMRYAIVIKMFAGLYMLNNPSIINTRDPPTKEQIPFYFDIKTQMNRAARLAGQPEPFDLSEEATEEADTTIFDYIKHLHQQINVILVFGSLFLFFFYRFGVKFGKLVYASTFGAFIKLCIKIWFLIKFVVMYIIELLKKLYRTLRKCAIRIRAFLRRRAKKAQNLALAKAGKEHQTVEEIDAEEDRQAKLEVKMQEKADRKEDRAADGEDAVSDAESLSKSQGSIQSAGAMGAIEEASRKMRLVALKAYQSEVIRARLDRTDYSSNVYRELNMISLDQLYERSKKEYNDFKAMFKMNQATEKYIENVQPKNKKNPNVHCLRENFLEQCYMSNLTEQDVKDYDELLKKRIKDLEEVIDGHFLFIQAAIVEEAEERRDRDIEKTFAKEDYRQKIDQRLIEHKFANNPDLKFDDLNYYTHTKKLEQLKDHQDQLVKADKEDINNRRNLQRICRMQGSIAQSYFIYDSPQYKVARKIYFALEGEEQELRNQQEIDDINEYETVSDEDYDSEEESSVAQSGENLLKKDSEMGSVELKIGKKN